MKSRDDVEKRLRHLRVRYTTQWIRKSQERRHRNCAYNREHVQGVPTLPPSPDSKIALAPRKNVTLVVLRDPAPVCLCMYGAEDPSKWPGNLCDNDEVARQCPMFKPLQDAEAARTEFENKLADDKWVYDNRQDVATLQWVLAGSTGPGKRAHSMKLSWFQRLILWFASKRAKTPPALPQPPSVSVPDDLWREDVGSVTDDSDQAFGARPPSGAGRDFRDPSDR